MFFYTGAVKTDQIQTDISKSLGGWISSSIIPNSKLGNLFSGISQLLIENPKSQIKVIALKNLTGATQNVTIFTETPVDSYSIFKIGIAQPMIDPVCGPFFETLTSEDSLPYSTQVAEHEGLANGIVINSFANNAFLGLFIVRELKSTVPGYKGAEIPCTTFESQYGQPIEDQEQTVIKISY